MITLENGEQAPATSSEARQPVVLCVDDERSILSALQRVFRPEPYELLTTEDPREALDWVTQRNVNVLVADQRMPGLSGIELLTAVQHRSPVTARILLTAHADAGALKRAINEGRVHQYWSKPWDDGNLRETLRRVLQQQKIEERGREMSRRMALLHNDLREGNETLKGLLQLQTQKSRLSEEILDRIPTPLAALSRAGAILACNSAFRKACREEGQTLNDHTLAGVFPDFVGARIVDLCDFPGRQRLRQVPLGRRSVNLCLESIHVEGNLLGVLLQMEG